MIGCTSCPSLPTPPSSCWDSVEHFVTFVLSGMLSVYVLCRLQIACIPGGQQSCSLTTVDSHSSNSTLKHIQSHLISLHLPSQEPHHRVSGALFFSDIMTV